MTNPEIYLKHDSRKSPPQKKKKIFTFKLIGTTVFVWYTAIVCEIPRKKGFVINFCSNILQTQNKTKRKKKRNKKKVLYSET